MPILCKRLKNSYLPLEHLGEPQVAVILNTVVIAKSIIVDLMMIGQKVACKTSQHSANPKLS